MGNPQAKPLKPSKNKDIFHISTTLCTSILELYYILLNF